MGKAAVSGGLFVFAAGHGSVIAAGVTTEIAIVTGEVGFLVVLSDIEQAGALGRRPVMAGVLFAASNVVESSLAAQLVIAAA